MSREKSPKIPICNTRHAVDLAGLEDLHLEALDSSKAQQMAEFFRLLGDGNRLRILSLLAQRDLCVCDLASLLSMSESAVSHQLRTLRSLRLVNYDKRGRKVFYRLLDHHVLELYQSVAEHLAELDPVSQTD
ncbi:MAG: metalloregulator ArsR/SmtB family transcription factor [Hydrococcus sp. SU_1_0]|nr:metalloregulator ArsR/SmtB family transcription factor [Hydrococcus sp. SU_1_0]